MLCGVRNVVNVRLEFFDYDQLCCINSFRYIMVLWT